MQAQLALGPSSFKPSPVVSYVSRALIPVETRYSQNEREALAIIWACAKFHLYLYGTEFRAITDHKPLERLFNDPSSKPLSQN